MEPPLDTDHRIARLAAAQHGVVRHRDLLDLGLTQPQIRHRREVGRLITLHPEVYAVGHDRVSPTGRRLAARLTAILDTAAHTELALTLSELEDRFRALCTTHGLPLPAANARPLGWRVDFLWAPQRLVVETDGWRTHRTRAAFEDDRARDQRLVVADYRVVRFTHRQIVDAPETVAQTIADLLRGFDP